MYSFIIHPNNGIKYRIDSKMFKFLMKKYINHLKGGSIPERKLKAEAFINDLVKYFLDMNVTKINMKAAKKNNASLQDFYNKYPSDSEKKYIHEKPFEKPFENITKFLQQYDTNKYFTIDKDQLKFERSVNVADLENPPLPPGPPPSSLPHPLASLHPNPFMKPNLLKPNRRKPPLYQREESDRPPLPPVPPPSYLMPSRPPLPRSPPPSSLPTFPPPTLTTPDKYKFVVNALTQIGAHNLIEKFKSEMVDTDALMLCKEDDFMGLGLNKSQANKMMNL